MNKYGARRTYSALCDREFDSKLEARRGEELGFGTAFISERWNVKEAASLTGAACAVTDRMQIATAATNHNTRHPLITGSWATTMHRLSGGRFTLGVGRGIAAMPRPMPSVNRPPESRCMVVAHDPVINGCRVL